MLKAKRIWAVTVAFAALLFGGIMMQNFTSAAAASNEDNPLYQPAKAFVDEEGIAGVLERNGRTWQGGAPGIARTKGGRLFACLFSGGINEPQPQNYAIYQVSDDDGETWIDPFFVVEHPHEGTRCTDPSVQVDSLGRLWLCWNQQYPMTGSTQYGWWVIRIDDPDVPLDELREKIASTPPVRLTDGVRINKFVECTNGEWIQATAVNGGTAIRFYVSTDKGETWQHRGWCNGEGTWVGEPCVAEMDGGRLWLLTRYGFRTTALMDGGVGEAFSDDGGAHWTTMESSLEPPLRGVCSRLYLGRLKSGAYLFVTNDSPDMRRNLTAYLSLDGETWPYSLLLDGRDGADGGYMSGPAYPDVEQAPDGKIYCAYDFGRYNEKEMRMAVFTEEDIKAGAFVSDVARQMVPITKVGPYADILSVTTKLPETLNLKAGNSPSEALEKLPSEVSVVDETGATRALTGNWSVKNYVPNTAGEYDVVFTIKEADSGKPLQDTYSLLKVTLIVGGNGLSGGAIAGIAAAGGAVVLGGAAAGIAIPMAKKKKRGSKV